MRRHAKAIVAISALLLLTLVVGVTMAVATAPTVTLEGASSVTYTSAEVSGKVDPKDEETTYRFEYTTDPNQGWTDGEENAPLAAGSGEASVSEQLTGLRPGTGYYVRLVAENADGQSTSAKGAPLFTTVAVAPPTVSILPPDPLTATDATYRGEINPGGTDPAFDVTYRFECTPSCVEYNQGSIPADNSSHQVSVQSRSSVFAPPLKPNFTYEVSLVAENAGGAATAGPLSFTTPATAPEVLGSNAKAFRDEAILNARVQPGGLATTYRFEYGPTAAYGSSTPAKQIGGSDPVDLETGITGLTPGTTYHFRIVLENSLGTVAGPDRTFTTAVFTTADACPNAAIRAAQGAGPVGDCRAFEKVSPNDKNGSDISLRAGQSSLDGNAVAFQSYGAFANPEAGSHADDYVARRGPDGWSTEPVSPFQKPYNGDAFVLEDRRGYEMFTSDLSRGVLGNWNDPNEKDGNVDKVQRMLFLRGAGGGYTQVTPALDPPPNPLFTSDPVFIGASEDLSRVFFESSRHVTPDAPPAGTNEVYEWADGEISVVGVLPDGTIAPAGATTARIDGNVSYYERKWSVSPDGSDVVFQSGSPEQVYLRSDGTTTTQVSLSQKAGSEGDPAATGAKFMAGVRDSSGGFAKLYFVSSTELTDDAFTGPTQEGSELYEYDVATGELRALTANEEPRNPNGARVGSEWLRVSANGEYLYFLAEGLLVPGLDEGGYYVLHDGQFKRVGPDASFSRPWISDDGRRALIFSFRTLTGDVLGDIGPEQAYVYDQPSGTITCASCQPVQKPLAAAPMGFITGYWHVTNHEQRNISADGSRAFFQTEAALVPDDVNGQADVYRWENGDVELVSSGRGPNGANFLDASPSGDDVFIATNERILPTDRDSNVDIYDARVNGGLPLPPTAGAPCEGDACQSPPAPPNDATPASAGFSGPGNAKPRFGKPRKQKKQAKARHKQRGKQKQAKKKRGAKKRAQARPATRSNG